MRIAFNLSLTFVICINAIASAQNTIPQPQLLSIFPPGAKAGTTLELEITGETDLAVATGLNFSHPGIKAEPITSQPDRFYPDARPSRNRFRVSIAADVPAGFHEVRAQCRYGTSNARRFVVSHDEELIEEEPNNEPGLANDIRLGSTVNGTFGADFDMYRLEAKRGQQLVIDCLAERIDSQGDPVLTLLDLDGKTLMRVQDTVGTDAALAFTVDRDQTFLVRVNDLTFMAEGGGDAAYRLTVRQGPWIDFVDPPFAVKGKSNKLTIYGTNLDGQPVDASQFGKPLEKIVVDYTPPAEEASENELVIQPFQSVENLLAFRHTIAGRQSNAIPIMVVDASNGEMQTEVEPNETLDTAQKIDVGDAILAKFDQPNDVDLYRFTASKDQRVRIQIQSHQLNGSSDPLLVVQVANKQNDGTLKIRDLKVVDDESNDNNTFRFRWSTYDPGLEFVAPEDGDYFLLVQDQAGTTQGFPNYYRMTIGEPDSDFRLLACAGLMVGQNNNRNTQIFPSSCVVRRGGSAEILLVARRSGSADDEIHVQVGDLPAGVTAEPVTIGPGEDFASVVIRAAPDAKAWTGPIKIIGKVNTAEDRAELTRIARAVEFVRPTTNNNQSQATSRIGQQIYLSVDDETPVAGRIETPELKLRMARGGRLEVPLKFIKQNEFTGNVNAFACGLPNQISRNNINLQPDGKEAKMNLDVQQGCTPGIYSFFVRADLDQDFRRYPELIDQAKEDQTRLNNLFNEWNRAYQKSTQDRSQSEQQQRNATNQRSSAEKTLRQRQQEFSQADSQLKEAEKAVKAADTKLKQAIVEVAAATTELAVAKDEPTKKTAQANLAAKQQTMQSTESSVTAAKSGLDQAAAKQTAAKKQLDDATMQMQSANEMLEKANADLEQARTDETTARQDRDTAQKTKSQADQWVQRANQITQQRRVKTYAHSPTISIEVVAFPIEFKLDKPAYELVAGEQLEITVTSEREFDANEEIRFQILPPQGIGGWNLGKKQKTEKNANTGQVELIVPANTKPGIYEANLRASYRFQNRFINQDIPLPITIKAPEEKKE